MATEANVRACGPDDAEALALVGRATFLETFAGILDGAAIVAHCGQAHAAAVYDGWLNDKAHALWLVETTSGSAPVGFMVVSPPQLPVPDTEGDLELKRIYLLSKFQGGGVGKRLIAAAAAHAIAAGANRLLLGVYAGNAPAIGFYERAGFRKIGERKFRVGGRDYDDQIMAMSLAG
ncbi:MAG TPA: GNAT family N-acetyltransferase [Stenotrophomonas sp.]|nr:GNAT family N-acetyltransferase [Stenotrophomonas sp.]